MRLVIFASLQEPAPYESARIYTQHQHVHSHGMEYVHHSDISGGRL
jgi:hypothetical protein